MVKKKDQTPDEDLSKLLDFDELTTPVEPESEVETEEAPVVQTPASPSAEEIQEERIRELERKLAAPLLNPTTDSGRPVADSELTPQQKRIRELEDQLAKRTAKELENRPEAYDSTQEGESILIHFLEDGFTSQGRIWYRGQEVEFFIGSKAYEQTKNRYGRSWLEDTEEDQYRRYGKLYWRRGGWPGHEYTDDEAAKAERKRNRAAPVVTL